MTDEAFFFYEDKRRGTLNVTQIAFAPSALKAGVCGPLRVRRCGVCTYGLVADGAERLQVVQRALSSSAVDRPDVVDLPEIPFDRSADHLIQLETQTERSGERLGTLTAPGSFLAPLQLIF